eukprot:CAMPEP_0174272712 /NCGR_PEP_ID=MMETSP0439-20130205/52218_1 /TAXON_ID=0 /ORGANISM="Stereomyxa ramosa, Strain Chinc5" /LENGTH=346 /DNA_ID=CAMNT_0015363455 /DNA_START=212 /DNA_END=1249 /DNA_ORIENTATION=-
MRKVRGRLFGFGRNCRGQLGLSPSSPLFSPTPIPFLARKIKSISMGTYHSILLTDEGKAFGAGYEIRDHFFAKEYKRGIEKQKERVEEKLMEGFENISELSDLILSQIACGDNFAMFLDEKGRLGGFGTNERKLIQYEEFEKNTKGKSDGWKACVKEFEKEGKKEEMIVYQPPSHFKIQKIVCGWGHVLLLVHDSSTNSNSIFSWGINRHGQCGLGHSEDVGFPEKVKGLEGINVSDVAAGASHSLALCDQKHVYIWGSHKDGKLGLGEVEKDLEIATKLNFETEIEHIACGVDHSAVLSPGHLYLWGFGQHGALGFGGKDNVSEVKELKIEENFNKLVRVDCGMD